MDQRSIERLDVGGTVLCRIGDAETRDELRDMSVRGCKLVGVNRHFAKGDAIDITLLDGVSIAGTVRWAAAGDVGVEFGEKLSEAAVRYFTLSALGPMTDDVPFDSFGRKLPPLHAIED